MNPIKFISREQGSDESEMIRSFAFARPNVIGTAKNLVMRAEHFVEQGLNFTPDDISSSRTSPGETRFSSAPAPIARPEIFQRVAEEVVNATQKKQTEEQVIFDAGVEAAQQKVRAAFRSDNYVT